MSESTNPAYDELEEKPRVVSGEEKTIHNLLSGETVRDVEREVLARRLHESMGLTWATVWRVLRALDDAEVSALGGVPAATVAKDYASREDMALAALQAKNEVTIQYARSILTIVSQKIADVPEEHVRDLTGMFRILKRAGWPVLVRRGTREINVLEDGEIEKILLRAPVVGAVPVGPAWPTAPITAPANLPPNLNAFDEPEPTSVQILEAAVSIQEQRAEDYDSEGGERSMANTVRAFNIITGREDDDRRLTESEGWEFMVLLKLVRDRSVVGGHKDSLLDAVSYAALMGEARLREDTPEQDYGDEDAESY